LPVPAARPSSFDVVWAAHAPELVRVAAIYFDDARLEPPPDPRQLLDDARSRIASDWPNAPREATDWLRTRVAAEFLGHAHRVYAPALHRLLRGQVWSDEIVEELVQGAAARAAERLDELVARPRPLFGWLCQLVRQQRIDWLRARSAAKRDAGRTVPLDVLPRLADTGTTPTQAERRTRVREMFDRVLTELPSDDVLVLRLHADEHLGPSDIATRLGIQPGDARIRLFRARRRALKHWLELFPGAAADLAELGLTLGDTP
jgi:RNA polymerase sigma factor (sigma-70 family)